MLHDSYPKRANFPISNEELARIREQAMDFANVGIYRYRMDGTVVFIDAGVLRLLDMEDEISNPSELFGRNISELIQYLEPPRSLRNQVMEQGSVKNVEYHYRTLKGQERWVYHSVLLVSDPSTGEPELLVLARDITDLKESTLALAASEQRLRTLMENSPLGLLVSSGEPARVVLVNPAMCRITGMNERALLQVEIQDLIERFHPGDRDGARVLYSVTSAPESDPGPGELRLVDPSGKITWVELRSSAIHFDGKPAVQTIVMDVTARMEAQRQRREMEIKMQDSQRLESLGVLAGGVAHDFNNILVAIMGNAELLQERVEDAPDLKSMVSEISLASERATDLCRQLLAYSGRKILEKQPLDLNRVVEDTYRLLGVTVSKRVQLTRELSADLPAVLADASQVGQVVMNLVTNASEALGGCTGHIVLRTGSSEMSREDLNHYSMGDQLAPGRYAFFEVEDDGCGMEESIRARIFEPFFSTKFTGRGLGLAAVRGIVQGHGGAFEVESRVRQGTRIRVIFPVSDSQVLGRSNDDRVKASRCFSGTVLLVDDEATPRRVTARILEKIGYECVQAENGEEALERFREDPHRFRLVVLDVVMPVLDGPGCYQQLRRVRPECPVLFISGYDDGGLMTELSNPFTAFLQKPYGIPAFKEACCRLTEPTRQENSQGT